MIQRPKVTKKQQTEKILLRYYDVPQSSYVLAILGDAQNHIYGHSVNTKHYHNVLEIGYCHDGEGEMIFAEDRLRYTKNMFTIIPPNYPHITSSSSENNWDYLFIDLEVLLTSAYPNNPKLKEVLLTRIFSHARILTRDAYPRIAHLILEIIRESREENEFFNETRKSYLMVLILEMARINTQGSRVPELLLLEQFPRIGNALLYMEAHYNENIKVSRLAEECNLSETQFRRIFSEKINYTPQDYLVRIRIHFACRFLLDENVSIEEAAMKCGYASMSTFNRNFKKVMHQTPKSWRQGNVHNTININNYMKESALNMVENEH